MKQIYTTGYAGRRVVDLRRFCEERDAVVFDLPDPFEWRGMQGFFEVPLVHLAEAVPPAALEPFIEPHESTTMPLAEARSLVEPLLEAMRPFCERIEVAGSIRREKNEVRDLEIVAVPRYEKRTVTVGLFQEERTYEANLLHSWATNEAVEEVGVRWIKPGTSELVLDWPLDLHAKYYRGFLPAHNVKLDLFLARPETFGLIYLIRTGSADFSQEVVTHAKRIGVPCQGGQLWRAALEMPISTPEEEDVFRVLGLQYVPPNDRTSSYSVKRLA